MGWKEDKKEMRGEEREKRKGERVNPRCANTAKQP